MSIDHRCWICFSKLEWLAGDYRKQQYWCPSCRIYIFDMRKEEMEKKNLTLEERIQYLKQGKVLVVETWSGTLDYFMKGYRGPLSYSSNILLAKEANYTNALWNNVGNIDCEVLNPNKTVWLFNPPEDKLVTVLNSVICDKTKVPAVIEALKETFELKEK